MFVANLQDKGMFGENQFAYLTERGARDALAFVVLTWILGWTRKMKFAIYCSDVSGAFDRVKADRLILKLTKFGVHSSVLAVLESWLEAREANVVVEGQMSKIMELLDMVYQGTVWGPPLWNAFYGDARTAVHKCGFTEVVFADDLNAFKEYSASTPDETLHSDMEQCQTEVHKWGAANQVAFDPAKESKHILATQGRGSGGAFKLLGVTFDSGLIMADEIHNLVIATSWKIAAVARTSRFFPLPDLVNLYKSKVLSFVESRTAGIYHACSTHLGKVDALQTRFLRDRGISEKEALMSFGLAPLCVRRDIAMLGLIHRSVLGKGPNHFSTFFVRAAKSGNPALRTRLQRCRHSKQLIDMRDTLHLEIARRSAQVWSACTTCCLRNV